MPCGESGDSLSLSKRSQQLSSAAYDRSIRQLSYHYPAADASVFAAGSAIDTVSGLVDASNTFVARALSSTFRHFVRATIARP